MTIEEMRAKKREFGYTYEQIAERSGVPLGTVQKIFGGVTTSPRYDTLAALESVFALSDDAYIREAAAEYTAKKPGEYTIEDYAGLPEERRAELIDGIFYDMTAPKPVHQLISGRIYMALCTYVTEKSGTCVPIMSPIDVQLDCDEKTMVQPDLLVVCDRSRILDHCILGAPDFVIEILSKSTKRRDLFIKADKYLNAGVREYWVIDPDKKMVVKYDFANDNYPVIYGFDTEVPVSIFQGECMIDFKEIYRYVEFLYEERK